ncbi:ATP-dependent Clp protease proteolytic subunit [Defluviimonas sp. D31]|uniref:SDH family Clp fold serine proteinase n=1 Tax=Defluviimonas sp. D31 TaxID=3083253 RepID=UPI00296F0A27|nr:ATP-dependent Clp protease proteolytic subunit [Defluviimonas sp. D31]MDW4549009.1 ATP-dependent Clp protease proteolytic subunit [Defluviimonas sp. D31]
MSFSITDALWLFLILSALQPMIARKITDMRRLAMISQIEKQRGSRVILMVHRQETMRLLGFPLVRYIDIQDSEDVLRAIRMTDDDMPLDIVLHTPGGLVLAALQIARAVEAHKGKVTVFVPHHAMSGGTLIALAADEIVMCEHSVLGPIDPQIGQYPAASILSAVERKPVAEVDDATLILADVARKALDQVIGAATALLSVRMPKEKAAALAGTLASGTWTHDYPIAAAEAAALGLPVATTMPEEVLTLMTLYPQPVRQSGGVEFLPVPRERPARAPKG